MWLYNPTDVFTTWRLLRGNTISADSILWCLLYFAEVPPLGKLAIPFAFMPTEMIDYEVILLIQGFTNLTTLDLECNNIILIIYKKIYARVWIFSYDKDISAKIR